MAPSLTHGCIDCRSDLIHIGLVSKVEQIEAALPELSPAELRRIVQRADELFRTAKGSAIYHDAYGTLSDAELIIAADQAFAMYDKEEARRDETAKG